MVIMLALLVAMVTVTTGSGPCPRHAYRSFSTRTSYEAVRGRDPRAGAAPAGDVTCPLRVTLADLDPAGCRPAGLWSLVRHGARHPARDEIVFMQRHLPDLRRLLVQHAPDEALCAEDIDRLQHWSMRNEPDDDLKMADSGSREMTQLGSRTRQRFASLMDDDVTLTPLWSRVHVTHTENPRAVESAERYLAGLLGENASVGKVQVRRTAESEDVLMLYTDLCSKYIQNRLNPNNTERLQTRDLDTSRVMDQAVNRMNHRLHLPPGYLNYSMVRSMYEACRFGFAVHNDVTWCSVFDQSELELLEYRQDMRYYWRYGYGHHINYMPACGLLRDVTQTLGQMTRPTSSQDPLSGQKQIRLLFGHSRTILPFLTLLGLFKDTHDLLASNYQHHRADRKWRLSAINPFSANIAFSLHSCDSGGHVVSVMLNERVIPVPGCGKDTVCDLERFLGHWRRTASQCDYHTLCVSDTRTEPITNINAFHEA